MGASTTTELIAKGKAENAYNNAGIAADGVWRDFFNEALRELVDELEIEEIATLVYDGVTTLLDLPSDYYNVKMLYTGSGTPITKRRHYMDRSSGYWILNKGDKWQLDIQGYSAQSFTLLYNRYAATLTGTENEKPEIPSAGEMALPLYAIAKALRNNNQIGQAQEIEQGPYKEQIKKIRTAQARARG